jgi:hypothetical protein
MMTFILVISFLLIAFIGLLRYDIHRHKHRQSEPAVKSNVTHLDSNPAHRSSADTTNVAKTD